MGLISSLLNILADIIIVAVAAVVVAKMGDLESGPGMRNVDVGRLDVDDRRVVEV